MSTTWDLTADMHDCKSHNWKYELPLLKNTCLRRYHVIRKFCLHGLIHDDLIYSGKPSLDVATSQ